MQGSRKGVMYALALCCAASHRSEIREAQQGKPMRLPQHGILPHGPETPNKLEDDAACISSFFRGPFTASAALSSACLIEAGRSVSTRHVENMAAKNRIPPSTCSVTHVQATIRQAEILSGVSDRKRARSRGGGGGQENLETRTHLVPCAALSEPRPRNILPTAPAESDPQQTHKLKSDTQVGDKAKSNAAHSGRCPTVLPLSPP